jgi:hypothetical protein
MAEDDASRNRAQHLAEMARMTQALPFDERSRLKAENVRDILLQRALELERAQNTSREERERLAGSRDLLNIRVDELLEHFAAVVPASQRARKLWCLRDALVGAFRIGTGGATNDALESAQRKAGEQTVVGRKVRAEKVDNRREQLAPLVQAQHELHPEWDAAKIARKLRLKLAFKAKFPQSRRTIESDVKAIMKNLATLNSSA